MKDKAGESVSYDGDVGRADYEAVVGELVETTIACCDRAIARAKEVANVGLEDIEHVILVGGSTRVPMVVRRVTEKLCKAGSEPLRDDVDTCVALGAAVHAAHIGGTLLGDSGVKVRITTPLVAQGAKLRLGLTVEEAPKGAAQLAILGRGARARRGARSPRSRCASTCRSARPRRRTRRSRSSPRWAWPLAELPLTIHRGDLRPRPTSLSRASVVAKDIALEVVRGGKRERKVLLARGTGLPAQVTQLFFTADQSGSVVLRILQNRLPIKTLVIDVPRELPVGSPVEVILGCDESMRLEAQGHGRRAADPGAHRASAEPERRNDRRRGAPRAGRQGEALALGRPRLGVRVARRIDSSSASARCCTPIPTSSRRSASGSVTSWRSSTAARPRASSRRCSAWRTRSTSSGASSIARAPRSWEWTAPSGTSASIRSTTRRWPRTRPATVRRGGAASTRCRRSRRPPTRRSSRTSASTTPRTSSGAR